MAYDPINPTQLTPPRVAFIDERSGAISREWYRFFLSLVTAVKTEQDITDNAPDTNSLLATYDAMLASVAQASETMPDAASAVTSLQSAFNNLTQEVQTSTSDLTGSLQQQIDNVFTASSTQPRNELGTISYLQQDNVPWITFSNVPTNVPPTVGTTFWDGGTTLNIQMTANVIGRVNETEFVYAKASAAITKGQLCYHTGAVGSSGTITVAPTPINLTDPNQIVGVAAETIALNGFGLIQVSGDLRGFNTTGSSVGETWADGDPLYYNPAYVGSFTKTKPSAPNQKTYIGEVINAGSGGSGSIHIRIVPGSVLGGTDSNVQFGTLVNSDLIQYDSALQYWKNVAPSTISVGTATNLAGGAANRIAYQTAPGTTSFIVAPTTANTFLEWSGSAFQWSSNPLGTVTSVSVVSANGLAGTVANPTTTPAITLSTTVTGVVKGNGTALSAAIAGTDYVAPGAITTSGLTMATARLLGRTTASTGAVEEISVAGGLTLTGGVLTGTSGTVTSVSGTGTVNGITLTGTVTSSGSLTLGGTLSNVSLTSQVTGTLPVGNGGTGTATAFTTGSVVFAGASGVYTQDNANFFWDNTNKRLGIGTASPNSVLEISKAAGAADMRISVGGTLYGNLYASASDTTLTSVTAIPLILGTNSTTRFQVGSVGQWGIGGATYGTAGQVFTSGGALAAPTWTTPTTGTVTSVSGTGTVNGITLTGTVTSSGSLTLGGTLSGVSLTTQVSGTLPITNGGTGSTSTTYCSLTTNVTGTLPVGNGGTGATTFTANALLKGNTTSAVSASNVSDNGSTVSIASGIGFSIARTTVTAPAAADGNVFSGTYTPTSFNTTNVAASTPQSAQYLRVGNTVTVSGQIDIDPTIVGFTILGLSLPIASNLTSAVQLSGVFNCPDAAGGGIYGDAANDRATFQMTATSAANLTYYYTFTYRVL